MYKLFSEIELYEKTTSTIYLDVSVYLNPKCAT